MPLSPQQFRILSNHLYSNPTAVMDFLKRPKDVAEAVLGASLDQGDVNALSADLAGIRVATEDGDRDFHAKNIIIFADGFGADESGGRRWALDGKPHKLGDPGFERHIEAMLDTEVLGTGECPGAALAIVWDGGTCTIGRGRANAADPASKITEETLFRVGSISKLVTATALMQLLETGQSKPVPLDLERNVNDYLTDDCKLPKEYGPITLKRLLTHSAGFEENQVGAIKANQDELVDLETVISSYRPGKPDLAHDMKPGTTPSGKTMSYSSWGLTLAGHILETCSGKTTGFDQVVAGVLLSPLKMTDSTFAEPLDPARKAKLATGHRHTKAEPSPDKTWLTSPVDFASFEGQDFEFAHCLAPAASLTTSAKEMANFMSAHLNAGTLEGKPVLDARAIEQMHECVVKPHPDVAGAALAFREAFRNGRRLLCHSGNLLDYTATLVLIPEEKVGVFVVVNAGGDGVPGRLHWFVRDLIDSYFPATSVAKAPVTGNLREYEGTYLPNVHSHTKNEKVLMLHPKYETQVRAEHNGTRLSVSNIAWKTWELTGQGVFRQFGDGGQDTLAFGPDKTYIVGPNAFIPRQRVAWHAAPRFHRGLLLAAALSFSGCLGAWLAGAQGIPAADLLATAISVLNLGALAAGFVMLAGEHRQLAMGFPLKFKAALVAILLSVPLTALFAVMVALAWLLGWWTFEQRVLYASFAIPALAFLWSMHCWNLIGFRPSWPDAPK